MNSMPPAPGPLPLPAPDLQVPDLPTPDPRSWGTAPDFAAMRALTAGLVVPGNASMYVMSALETSRELIRYSYYRYEFATVAVAQSLFALEHVLAERLGSDGPLGELIGRAAEDGLFSAGLAADLDDCRLLRDGLTRGARSSAAVTPIRAVARCAPSSTPSPCSSARPSPRKRSAETGWPGCTKNTGALCSPTASAGCPSREWS
ncbi:hypothetical protein [Streptomyces sp. A0592]|uniref:hypothetical protein n=1 Tax=Streptomyces sp. A0592 TaxID=2563099 RepID=UPI0019D13F5D|nr:hypothetical protein [Streptomyces sp. A0592]